MLTVLVVLFVLSMVRGILAPSKQPKVCKPHIWKDYDHKDDLGSVIRTHKCDTCGFVVGID